LLPGTSEPTALPRSRLYPQHDVTRDEAV